MSKVGLVLIARRAFWVFGFLLVVWGFYRLIFRFPEEIEELVIKPIIWLGIVGYMLSLEKRGWESVGWTTKGLIRNMYLGLGLGLVFAVEGIIVHLLKYGQINFASLGFTDIQFLGAVGLSMATAVSEETVFRGYIMSRLSEALKSQWVGVVVSTIMFILIHLPYWIFIRHLGGAEMLTQGVVLGVFSLGNGILYTYTRSIVGPIITHTVWGWAVVLFR